MLGATPEEWAHFDFVLGLGPNLLPCVPYSPEVRVVSGSALEGKVGKIPSAFNGRGEAHGILGWPARDISPAEVAAWSQDRRLNLCVRTGPVSGVYAFDIDIEDPIVSIEIANLIEKIVGDLPERARNNSGKILLMFRMKEPCKKRQIKTETGLIELLGDGQQFVACGTHSSGSRYRWEPALPSSIPTLTLGQVNSIWRILTDKHAKSGSTPDTSTAPERGPETTTAPEVMTEISDEDWTHLVGCLRHLLPHVADNDAWSKVGYALLSLQRSRPAERLWLDFSRKAVGYEPGAAEGWWAAHRAQQPRSDYRTIFGMARDRGLQRVSDPATFAPVPSNDDLVGSPQPERRLIQLSDDRYSTNLQEMEDALNPHVYTQGAHLVRPSEAHTDAKIRRSSDALMLIPATRGWARVRFGQICEFQKYVASRQEWVTVAPPTDHINTLLDRGGWSVLRPLDALARAPFLRADGSICGTPGYDPASRTLYVPSIEFPPIPPTPTQADAAAALERLRAPFNEFPWKEPPSEAAFVSHILAEAARLAMDHCPMYVYDAPMAGTGKSTLQEMAARIVHGTEPALRPWVADEDEIRKALYACLMAGDRSIWLDNVPDGFKVRSAVLEAFLTATVWKDRKLGESITTGIPNKTVLVASGNNLTPVAALARRSIVIRLDANTEHLRERVFRIPNPRRYVMEHRAQMLVDALTIIRAYLKVGTSLQPPTFVPPVPLPSFEEWSRHARDPLLWLGMADPVVTQLHETDDENQNIGPVFERLASHFGDRSFTAGDMARLVGSIADTNSELSDALQHMGCTEPTSPVKVGYWLRASKDKIGSGYKLVHDGHSKFGVRWRLQKLNGDLT